MHGFKVLNEDVTFYDDDKAYEMYKKCYGNVLMAMLSGNCVDDYFYDEEYQQGIALGMKDEIFDISKAFWNRGIHRLPLNFFQSAYANLSLVFHAFSCEIKNDKNFLIIHPMHTMHTIISKNLGPQTYEYGKRQSHRWDDRVPYDISSDDYSYKIDAQKMRNFFKDKSLAQKRLRKKFVAVKK